MKNLFLTMTLIALVTFAGCKKEEVNVSKEPGILEVEFDNVAIINGLQNQIELVTPGSTDYTYTNGMGQAFNINLLRYYISNIKLERTDGTVYADPVSVTAAGTKGIYLIDESNLASGLITLTDVPAGDYKKVTFTVGVEESGVQEGAAGGVLDPATCKMFWNWNSGYIAMKFEGQSPVSPGGTTASETIAADNQKGLAYHVGGWRTVEGTAFVNNNKTLSLTFDTNAKVEKGLQPHVHLLVDVMKFFSGQHTLDFSVTNNIHKPTDGTPVANNYAQAFAFDHVHQ